MAENVIITTTARAKLVQARAGAITLPIIAGMAFGSGGVDSSGAVIAPTADQIALNNELLRKENDSYTILSSATATVRYTCTLGDSELEGKSISEIGLYDSDGDLVCIKTFTAKGKDSDINLTFTIDDVF